MSTPRITRINPDGSTTTARMDGKPDVCDICSQQIRADESKSDDGSEVAHTACVAGWFRRSFGREGLS